MKDLLKIIMYKPKFYEGETQWSFFVLNTYNLDQNYFPIILTTDI